MPIEVCVVRVWEPDPPAGAAAVEWVRLTSEEGTTGADVRRVSGWYERRWVVEEYHKAPKTGVGVERRQRSDRDRRDPAVGVVSVVAAAVVNRRGLAAGGAAGDRPAADVLPRGGWRC